MQNLVNHTMGEPKNLMYPSEISEWVGTKQENNHCNEILTMVHSNETVLSLLKKWRFKKRGISVARVTTAAG